MGLNGQGRECDSNGKEKAKRKKIFRFGGSLKMGFFFFFYKFLKFLILFISSFYNYCYYCYLFLDLNSMLSLLKLI